MSDEKCSKKNENGGFDENYEVNDQGSLHKYRTEIPNVLLDLNLNPYELSVYLHLKRIAGDRGKCFFSSVNLSKKIQISRTTYRNVRDNLEKKGLIKVINRGTQEGCVPPLIEIVDLWPHNFSHFQKKFTVTTRLPGGGQEMTRGWSGDDHKEEPIKKNYIKKKESKPKKKTEHSSLASKEAHDTPSFSKDEEEIIDMLMTSILSLRPEFKLTDSTLQKWAIEIRLMIKSDNRDVEEIKEILRWLPTDNFWQKNILSASKLRIQFDKLYIEYEQSHPKADKFKEFAYKVKTDCNIKSLTITEKGVYDEYRDNFELSFLMPYDDFCHCLARKYEITDYRGAM